MADGSSLPRDVPLGRIRRETADPIVVGCLMQIACGTFDPTTERDLALQLLGRAMPLASASTRMTMLKPHAQAVLAAAPDRRKPGGSAAWCAATFALREALARDAIQRAASLVEV